MKNRYYHFARRQWGHLGVITVCAPTLGDAIEIMETIAGIDAGILNSLGEVLWLTPQSPKEHSLPIFARLLPKWSDHALYEIRT